VMLKMEVGSIADWVAGIGSAATAIIALIVLNHDAEARRDAARVELRRQASRIFCWLEALIDERAKVTMPGGRVDFLTPQENLAVMIRNSSEEAIYDCKVQFRIEPEISVDSGMLEYFGFTRTDAHQWEFQVAAISPTSTDYRGPIRLPGSLQPYVSAWLDFDDAAGHRWRRTTEGSLDEHPRTPTLDHQRSPRSPRVGCAVLWHGGTNTD
jgi:hypothetical protein